MTNLTGAFAPSDEDLTTFPPPQEPLAANTITITTFPTHAATAKNERTGSFEQLREAILSKSAAKKDALPWLKLARFGNLKTEKGSLRHDDNVLAITGIEADYDEEAVSVDEAVERLKAAGIRAMVYTSPSHTPEAPRWRVLCPVSTELPPEQREGFVARLNGALGGVLAGESFTCSQAYFFGSVKRNPAHSAVIVDGTPIDLLPELDAGRIGRPVTKAATRPKPAAVVQAGEVVRPSPKLARVGWSTVAELKDEIASGAGYHDATIRLAGMFAACGVPRESALVQLEGLYDAVPPERRDGRWQDRRQEVSRCLAYAYAKAAEAGADV